MSAHPPRIARPEDPQSWPCCRPLIIAHDVARSGDFSTAVVGGLSPFDPPLIGVIEATELPQKLYGHALANALVEVDRRYNSNALILADLTQDASYAEILFQTFGRRVLGVHISRYGEGQDAEMRLVRGGAVPVYTVGRSFLFDVLRDQFQAGQLKLSSGDDVRRAFDQLTKLQLEHRQTGIVYTCQPGQHDDLAISIAMLVWAAQHPYLRYWARALERRVRKPRPKVSWDAWT